MLIALGGLIAVLVLLGLLSRWLHPPEPPLSDDGVRALLAAADLGEIPPELTPAPPRPDVFSDRGYLRDAAHRAEYLPILLGGRAARALCVAYRSSADNEGRDAAYEYAWLDHDGRLQRARHKESYDPVHAALASGQGQIIVDMDASMSKGRVVTVVYLGAAHVVYEALRIE